MDGTDCDLRSAGVNDEHSMRKNGERGMRCRGCQSPEEERARLRLRLRLAEAEAEVEADGGRKRRMI